MSLRSISPFLFATFATIVAGFVDAVGYVHLGGLFLSFMSGNSTRLGIELAHGQWNLAGSVIAIIAGFVVGAFIGTLVTDAVGRWKLVVILLCEVALFALAILMTALGLPLALLPVAIAMGMQNSIHQEIAGADIGKSFVTGALFGLGQAFARHVTGRDGPGRWLAYAASWSSFIFGALLGALMAANGLIEALGAACLLLAVLAIAAFACREHLSRPAETG